VYENCLSIVPGISQAELAERMAVDRDYAGGLELGQRNPTLVTLRHWGKLSPLSWERSGTAALRLMIDHCNAQLTAGEGAPYWAHREWYDSRLHRTSSNSPFGRQATGSAIQRLMSDSCQPVPFVEILS